MHTCALQFNVQTCIHPTYTFELGESEVLVILRQAMTQFILVKAHVHVKAHVPALVKFIFKFVHNCVLEAQLGKNPAPIFDFWQFNSPGH